MQIRKISASQYNTIFGKINNKENYSKVTTKKYPNYIAQTLSDGTERRLSFDNRLAWEKLPTGEEREWHFNGQLAKEKLINGEEREWDHKGNLIYCKKTSYKTNI